MNTKILFTIQIFLLLSLVSKGQSSSHSPEYKILKGATIIDVINSEAKIGNIVIRGNIIQSIDYQQVDSFTDGAIIYDLHNHYIIPGLIDAHVHLATDPSGSDNIASTKLKLAYLLKHGVTAIRDMAGDIRSLSYLSRQASLDEISSPDIYYSALMAGRSFFDDPRTHSSGRGVTPGDCAWMKAVNMDTDMSLAIAEAKGTGATGIKVYADLEADVIDKIVAEAHRQGIKVWAHAAVFPAKPQSIVDAGVDVVSHATLLAWEGVDYLPSNAKGRYVTQENFDLDNPAFTNLIRSMHNQGTILDATIAVYDGNRFDSTIFIQGVDLTSLAFKNDVKIGVGTDNLNLSDMTAKPPILTEMQILHDHVGMSAMDVLRSATIINAEAIGIENQVGSIEMGKRANLLVLRKNPLANIKNIQSIRYVFKNGKAAN